MRERPIEFDPSSWADEDSDLLRHIEARNAATLNAYEANPVLVFEHANIERSTAQGGYGRRQLYELVQNGADALVGTRAGRIHVVLTKNALYCANEGEPVDSAGVTALLASHISRKRGAEIGRFGLGFKSVLSVTDRPEFYSWSGSFRFSAAACRREILKRVPTLADVNEDDRTPTLRMAVPISPSAAAEHDPVLRELMAWATTVVKLPLGADTQTTREWLAEDLTNFPREFMLFSPHVAQLKLENRVSQEDRNIEVTVDDGIRHLREDSDESRWRVFSVPEYEPSPDALQDAGELAHRETVPVIWAVPMDRGLRQKRGRFWAFFPTEYETTLAGIVNAPWKTNEDRQNLLPGAFNDELVGVLVDLVIRNLGELLDSTDPGSYLELLPARGREAPSPTDSLLTEMFYERASSVPSLPDQNASLQLPKTLLLHPRQATPRALEHWSAYPGRPVEWCHPTVFQRDRRACAERLIDDGSASIPQWLEALVEDGSGPASMAALRAATAVLDSDKDTLRSIRTARIVLTENGEMVEPDPNRVFLPWGIDGRSVGADLVHPELAGDAGTRSALETLGIQPADTLAVLRGLLAGGAIGEFDWDFFWRTTRGTSVDDSAPLIVKAQHNQRGGRPFPSVRVRTRDGNWKPLDWVLLRGAIVPTGEPEDDAVMIDEDFHSEDTELLMRLGARSGPEPGGGSEDEVWFSAYRSQAIKKYYANLESKSRPREDYLVFDRHTFAGPLTGLVSLGPEGRARLTEVALRAIGEGEPDWKLGHATMNVYPEQEFVSPAIWFLRHVGYVHTKLGPVVAHESLGPEMKLWDAFFPVATGLDDSANVFDLASSFEDVSEDQWQAAVDRAETVSVPPGRLGSFYAVASRFCETPERIQCRVGPVQGLHMPGEVTAVSSQEHFDTLVQDSVPVLLLESEADAETIVEKWGLKPASDVVRTTYSAVPITLGSTVGSRFPDLAMMSDEIGDMTLQPSDSILAVTYTERGRVTEEKTFVVDGDMIFYRQDLSGSDLLMRMADHFGLGLEPADIDAIMEAKQVAERRDLLRQIAQEPDDAARLSRLLGDEVLAKRLPQGLLAALDVREFDGEHLVARSALAVYGVGVLREYRDDLADGGWNPPATWTGGRDASAFVRDLGFDAIYAGRERRTRPPSERVDGPALLPPLHGFQVRIADATQDMFREEGGGRALLSLPTGAGKTRIAVESIVRSIRDGELTGPILWIAQTDELCEQAVETWSFVWRAIGPQQSLHISRLWGSFEAEPVQRSTHVVITTIAKILNRVDDPDYEWLSKADCAIVDEAHGSTTPSYTKVLSWLGFRRNRERIPLVGLTATPFRGTSTEQTKRLVNRYGSRRLDHGVFDGDDPYAHLQDMGVLAEVDHRILDGYDIELSADELAALEQLRRLPSNVGERIGANQERNDKIMSEVLSLPDDWPILLFAASVDHAQTLAALLTLEGVPAASVTGQTDGHVRRHYVEQFRTGDIRVLTNYNVLTQGFDAPATRAVVVARPTFSANLYQQMIGRGLRGPLNGGKERCLIVNVKDNVVQYGEQLAFYDFEYLWSRDEADA